MRGGRHRDDSKSVAGGIDTCRLATSRQNVRDYPITIRPTYYYYDHRHRHRTDYGSFLTSLAADR